MVQGYSNVSNERQLSNRRTLPWQKYTDILHTSMGQDFCCLCYQWVKIASGFLPLIQAETQHHLENYRNICLGCIIVRATFSTWHHLDMLARAQVPLSFTKFSFPLDNLYPDNVSLEGVLTHLGSYMPLLCYCSFWPDKLTSSITMSKRQIFCLNVPSSGECWNFLSLGKPDFSSFP